MTRIYFYIVKDVAETAMHRFAARLAVKAIGSGQPAVMHAPDEPTAREIDAKLIGGSALFGIGWGIAGFCPGGALPALGTGRWEVFLFTGALIGGILLAKFLSSLGAPRAQTAS